MRTTFDDQCLVTAGKDGCIMVFEIKVPLLFLTVKAKILQILKLKDKEARGLKLRDGFTGIPDEILITRGDLEDIKTQKDNLKNILSDNLQAQTNSLIMGTKDDVIKELEEQLISNKITF